MPGRHFDQFANGETIRHDVTRTVTETDNLLFTALIHNTQPMHLNAEVAAVAAFREARAGTVGLDGQMLDLPHLKRVQRLLETSRSVPART